MHDEKIKQILEIEKRQIVIGAKVDTVVEDVHYIKGRIDNGLSSSVHDMHENLTKLLPILDGHTRFIDRVQDLMVSSLKIFLSVFGLSLVGLFVWAITMGWVPKF